MVTIILERVPSSLRRELTRWMIEPKTGVFVGTMSAAVRERLWLKVLEKMKGGGCFLAYPSPNEQGFIIRSEGDTDRQIVDMDGLQLIKIKKA